MAEPLAHAAEADHDLVDDQQDPVLTAQLLDAGHVAGRRQEDARGAGDGLEDHGGHGGGALELDHVAQVGQRALGLLLVVLRAERGAVRVRGLEVDDAVGRRVRAHAPQGAGQVRRQARGAVVREVRGEHLVPTRVQACHPHPVLVGLRARVREEHVVDGLRQPLRDQPGRLGPGVVDVLRGRPRR
ncbi:Uncharacterised protein [Streptococcus pneumoniae]|nr:Uncharacterised protein [Streptococcus pneumoniae]